MKLMNEAFQNFGFLLCCSETKVERQLFSTERLNFVDSKQPKLYFKVQDRSDYLSGFLEL